MTLLTGVWAPHATHDANHGVLVSTHAASAPAGDPDTVTQTLSPVQPKSLALSSPPTLLKFPTTNSTRQRIL